MPKLKPNKLELAGRIITERSILYQNQMVKAIIENRKTQTRREKGLDPVNDPAYQKSITLMRMDYHCDQKRVLRIFRNGDVLNSTIIKSPYGKPGDLLWVKETWADASFGGPMVPEAVCFKADYSAEEIAEKRNKGIWKPSIFLPKSAARIWLMIEDVTIERIQDISEVDAIAEGVLQQIWPKDSAIMEFRNVWESINGPDSWKQNPWVWVIKFRVLSKTGRPDNDTILRNFTEVVKEDTYAITVKP